MIVFVDDINMPEPETYGAQPPLELLRQVMDKGSWYDLDDMSHAMLVDLTVVAAMAPPGGGRNAISPRLLSKFHLVCLQAFSKATLTLIFSTVMDWYLSTPGVGRNLASLGPALVNSTMEVTTVKFSLCIL